MLKKISSRQNSKFKEIVKFVKKNGRTAKTHFLIEDEREVKRALEAKLKILEAYFLEEYFPVKEVKNSLPENTEVYTFTNSLFKMISYRENPYGLKLLVEIEFPEISMINLSLPILILESIEKPGNLGALLRTADGAGFINVILLNPLCGLNNPNVIRASTGALFSLNIFQIASLCDLDFLKENGLKIVAADPYGEKNYFDVNLLKNGAIVLGNEDKGLSKELKEYADLLVKIPMSGSADSLNVAQAGTIMMFEAQRQKIVSVK